MPLGALPKGLRTTKTPLHPVAPPAYRGGQPGAGGDRGAVPDPGALEVPILLVDDEPRNLTALDAVLEAPRRRLLHAASGEEALRLLLDAGEVAAVVLDVHMPGVDGLETAALIREREQSRHTPIIFLTAGGQTNQSRGYALGAVDFLTKPFDPEALRAKLAVFEELYARTQEVRRLAAESARRARLEGALLAIRTAEHELGNQLGAASGYLQLLGRSGHVAAAGQPQLQAALARLTHAAETVRRLRTLTELPETDWGSAGTTIDLSAGKPHSAGLAG